MQPDNPSSRTSRKHNEPRRELARRELARRYLIDFCQYIDPAQTDNYGQPHLRLIADYLQRALDDTLWDDVPGRGKKILVITTPPRHWKSSLVSQKFPAWLVGKQWQAYTASTGQPPELILASYAAGLAQKNSKVALETIRDNPLYTNIFPDVKLSRTNQSTEEWKLEGSTPTTCKAAGVGGGLTGYGGIVIIDDPIKDRAQANSETYRQTLWDWWADVARTRINPGAFAIIVMTRWHDDDLVGRLMHESLANPGYERIVHLRLPALAESEAERQSAAKMGLPYDPADPLGRKPGEALCAAMVTAAEHEVTRDKYPTTHDALNQGRPIPAGGYLVSGDKFAMLQSVPTTHIRWVLATDFAITSKEAAPASRTDPDYTAATLVGLWTPNGNRDDARLVVANMQQGQLDPHTALDLIKSAADQARRITGKYIPIRSGQANADRLYLHNLRGHTDMLQYSIANLPRKLLPGDKVTKATPWIEMLHAGRVYLVSGNWNDTVRSAVTSFPKGTHDDIPDTLSVAVAYFGVGHKSHKPHTSTVNFYGD